VTLDQIKERRDELEARKLQFVAYAQTLLKKEPTK